MIAKLKIYALQKKMILLVMIKALNLFGHSNCAHKYTEVDVKKLREFLLDISLIFGNKVFEQSVGICNDH